MPIVAAPQDVTAVTGLSGTTSVISAGQRGQLKATSGLSCFSFTREGKQPAPYPIEVGGMQLFTSALQEGEAMWGHMRLHSQDCFHS